MRYQYLLLLITLFSGCTTHRRAPAEAQIPIFLNKTVEIGLPVDHKANHTVVADLNHDGFLDIILTQWHIPPLGVKVFLNQKGQAFKEVPVEGLKLGPSGILKVAKGLFRQDEWGVVLRYPRKVLETYTLEVTELRAHFVRHERSKLPPVISNWGDVQFLDFDHDGKLDVFATSFYMNESLRADGLFMFRQTSSGEFEDVSLDLGLGGLEKYDPKSRAAAVPSYMANVCDIDGDGHLELIVAGYGRRWNKIFFKQAIEDGSLLYHNKAYELGFDGDKAGRTNFRGNGNSFASQCGDLDGDGKLDIFQGEITHKWAGRESDLSAVLYNNYPKPFTRFSDLPRPSDFNDQGDIGSVMGDINLDGNLDLIIANSDYPPETKMLTLINHGRGKFINISAEIESVTNPKGLILFDMDRDGDLDLITGENAMRGHVPSVKFFNNQTQELGSHNFVSISLEGDGKVIAQSPVGARVLYHGKEEIVLRELVFGSGQDAVHPLETIIALPQDLESDQVEIEIVWNLKHRMKHNLKINRHHHLIFKPNL